MHITDLITVERINCEAHAMSKQHALELLSELLTTGLPSLSAGELFASLLEREQLGSTGLGHGVAIPHGRLKDCPVAVGAFLQLTQGVDFGATDRQPVDLLIGLIVPDHFTDEHLEILSLLASLFSDKEMRGELRSATTAGGAFKQLTHWQEQHAHA